MSQTMDEGYDASDLQRSDRDLWSLISVRVITVEQVSASLPGLCKTTVRIGLR